MFLFPMNCELHEGRHLSFSPLYPHRLSTVPVFGSPLKSNILRTFNKEQFCSLLCGDAHCIWHHTATATLSDGTNLTDKLNSWELPEASQGCGTNSHKPGGFKQQKCVVSQLGRLEVVAKVAGGPCSRWSL